MKLAGRKALVTGSSRGIGRAIAEAFGREGASVAVNYVSDASAAASAVAAIQAAGSEAFAVQADTSDPQALRRLFSEAEKALGGLDIVVNNTHPGAGAGLLASVDDGAIESQLAALRGYIIAMQETARRIRDNGAVINISSGLAQEAMPQFVLYSAVKASVDQLSRCLSRELATRGVRVNTLAPGLIVTDRTRAFIKTQLPGSETPRRAPFDRPGEPDEVADVAVFLASNDARWVNTQTLYASGGATYAQ